MDAGAIEERMMVVGCCFLPMKIESFASGPGASLVPSWGVGLGKRCDCDSFAVVNELV